ncbi:hypothetical protein PC123_g9699 [Phytophthora cactorum]|nr:hypothetical protein PC123_g9699 [Phytophthora cactorum]
MKRKEAQESVHGDGFPIQLVLQAIRAASSRSTTCGHGSRRLVGGEAAVLQYAAALSAAGSEYDGSGGPTASSPSMAGARKGHNRGRGGRSSEGRTSGHGVVTTAGSGDDGSGRPTASSPSVTGSRRGRGRDGNGRERSWRGNGAVPGTPQGTVATTRERTPDSPRWAPAARTPPMMLQEVYLNKLVAFTSERKAWMKSKHYRPIGPAYIVGRVCQRPMRGKFASLFGIHWLDSQFQNVVEHVSVGCVQSGVENYKSLTQLKDNPDWQELVTGDVDGDIDVDDDDDLQVEDDYAEFDPACRWLNEYDTPTTV